MVAFIWIVNGQFYFGLCYRKSMAYRKIPISRSKLIAAYWKDGYRQTLRSVAEQLDISYNTARNWLIKFELYESQTPNRGRKNKVQ